MSLHLLRKLFIPTDRNLPDSVNFAVEVDTRQIGVEKKCEKKKYEECGMILPSKTLMITYGTAELELATATVNPETIETRIGLLIRTMGTFQLMNV